VKHIDVARFVADSSRVTDRAHLASCASCREAVDALVRAERLLGGNTQVLSAPERDAILQRVLAAVVPAEALVASPAAPSFTARIVAWCKRGWPVLVPAAMAASVLLWWLRPVEPDAFVVRGTDRVDVPASALCVDGERVHPATSTTPCANADEVVLRVQLAHAAVVHVFGRGLTATPAPAGQRLEANREAVLDDSWTRQGTDPPRLTVVACDRCDRATASRYTSGASGLEVWHIDVPWGAP
jgi:hypothetical protein